MGRKKIRSSEQYGEIRFRLFVIGVMKTNKDLVSEEEAKIKFYVPSTWGIGRVPNPTLIAKVIYRELQRKKSRLKHQINQRFNTVINEHCLIIQIYELTLLTNAKKKAAIILNNNIKKTAQIIFSGFIFYTLFRGCTNSKFNSFYSSFFVCGICRIKNHLTSHFIQYEIITLCSWYGILIIRLSN